MNFVAINERAAAQAMDAIVGPDARVLIEKLYELLNQAEQAGFEAGIEAGRESLAEDIRAAFTPPATEQPSDEGLGAFSDDVCHCEYCDGPCEFDH